MIRTALIAFTDTGKALSARIAEALSGMRFRDETIEAAVYPHQETKAAWEECRALVFIGASGIAVRYVAPLLTDKLHDPAVIVIDELGRFVIPLLAGHVGGANHFARLLAEKISAVPVITTATDVEGVFSVDEFAAENGLKISAKSRIKPVAKMLLEGKPVNLALADDVIVSGDESDIDRCILHLMMRPAVVGMGCRRDKDPAELEAYFLETLGKLGVELRHVACVASIDVKKDEKALTALCAKYDIPLRTYSAEELREVPGEFEGSAFVEKTVGVSDVSARAAARAGGAGKFLLKKDSRDGMTISVFEKYRRVTFDYE